MDPSYLSQQVTSIIAQLHNLFDEIGVPHLDRDSREAELFSSLSETLHNHLRHVSSEKNEMVQQAQRLITTIKQMEGSLEDKKPGNVYENERHDLTVTYPLNECLHGLKEKHRTVGKLHQERYEQVKKLIQALESYSSHLETSFLQIKLPPSTADGTIPPTFDLSPSYINSVDAEFSRVFEEYTRRVALAQQLAEEIIKLWAELGTPQAQTDATIIHCWQDSPEQLGLHKDDLNKLKSRREKLLEEKRGRERKLKDLRCAVESLWTRLSIEEREQKAFLSKNRGCGLRAINDLEDELSRLNELKKQKIHLFVEDARSRLHTLWDELYFSEEEAVEFTPMFCDVYSDALLSAHEAEISRLEALKDQRAPIISIISRHRSLVKDRDDLAQSSQDGSRLLAKGAKGEKRDPTRLLREEKMRKRIARDLPKVEQDLTSTLEHFEEEYGRPFLVFGENYLDVIQASNAKVPPPRAKTPNGMAPPNMPKTAPHPSRPGMGREVSTISSASTLRSRPPTAADTLPRRGLGTTQLGSSVTKSPSRIPARAPLGNMPHGGNSPQRSPQHQGQTVKQNENSLLQARSKMAPPLLAPPPKMRQLFQSSTSEASSHDYDDDVSCSGSVIRNTAPEDPYYTDYDSTQHAQHHNHIRQQKMPPPPRPRFDDNQNVPQHGQNTDYAPNNSDRGTLSSVATTSTRQLSGNSSVAESITTASSCTTAASGSENWETFGDSENEDATPAPRLGAKRALEGMGEGYFTGNGTVRPGDVRDKYASKKIRPGLRGPERTVNGARDASWTDDDG